MSFTPLSNGGPEVAGRVWKNMATVAFLSLIFSVGVFYNAWDARSRGLKKMPCCLD
jgi:hypothetical protein